MKNMETFVEDAIEQTKGFKVGPNSLENLSPEDKDDILCGLVELDDFFLHCVGERAEKARERTTNAIKKIRAVWGEHPLKGGD